MIDKGTLQDVVLDQREESEILLKRCGVARECEKALAQGLLTRRKRSVSHLTRIGLATRF